MAEISILSIYKICPPRAAQSQSCNTTTGNPTATPVQSAVAVGALPDSITPDTATPSPFDFMSMVPSPVSMLPTAQ